MVHGLDPRTGLLNKPIAWKRPLSTTHFRCWLLECRGALTRERETTIFTNIGIILRLWYDRIPPLFFGWKHWLNPWVAVILKYRALKNISPGHLDGYACMLCVSWTILRRSETNRLWLWLGIREANSLHQSLSFRTNRSRNFIRLSWYPTGVTLMWSHWQLKTLISYPSPKMSKIENSSSVVSLW